MDTQEMRKLSASQCQQMLQEQQAELVNLRFKVRQGQLQQVHQLREVRTALHRL
jgi:ribosomal protein L29